MQVVNDNSCSWINDLDPRTDLKSLKSNENCEWIIIGAGYQNTMDILSENCQTLNWGITAASASNEYFVDSY